MGRTRIQSVNANNDTDNKLVVRGTKQFLSGLFLGILFTALTSLLLSLWLSQSPLDPEPQDMQQIEQGGSEFELDMTRSRTSRKVEATEKVLDQDSTQGPSETWQSLITDDINDASQTVQIIQSAEIWWDQHGISALDHLYSSSIDSALRDTVMNVILDRASKSGWERAFGQVARLTGESREWALEMLVLQWVKTDPQAALRQVSALPMTDSFRRVLQRVVAVSWAEADPEAIMQNTGAIPENIWILVEETALLSLARESPETAAQFLTELSGSSQESLVAKEIALYWGERDVVAALAWVRTHSFSNAELREEAMDLVFRAYAKSHPQVALQAALELPINKVGLEAGVIEVVALDDVELAIEMLDQVRDGRTSDRAYYAVGRTLVVANQDFERAIGLGEGLAPGNRSNYHYRLAMHWGAMRPISLLENLDAFPEQARSTAAKSLLMQNQATLALTSEQIEHAKTYLNPKDLRAIEALPEQHVRVVRFTIGASEESDH